MNYKDELKRIIGSRLLKMDHFINLTCLRFGVFRKDDGELDDSYGLEITCPWVIRSRKNFSIIAASGDCFSPPSKMTGIKRKEAESTYSLLDEILESALITSECCVKRVIITENGDLIIDFSNGLVLHSFIHTSVKLNCWWFFKCGGTFVEPLEKIPFAQISRKTKEWWVLMCDGTGLVFRGEQGTAEAESVLKLRRTMEWGEILKDREKDSKSLFGKSARSKTDSGEKIIQLLTDGYVAEIGRKYEQKIKSAPVSWISFHVPEKSSVKEKGVQEYLLYMYCPWRIRNQKDSSIIFATADMLPKLCWDERLNLEIQETDLFEEKAHNIFSEDITVVGGNLSNGGNFSITFSNGYNLEFFLANSGDSLCWSGYKQGDERFVEGGASFLELHTRSQAWLKERQTDRTICRKWLKALNGVEVISLKRRMQVFCFTFKLPQEAEKQEIKQCDIGCLIFKIGWRIVHSEKKTMLLAGNDIFLPDSSLKTLLINQEISWPSTCCTRYDELAASLFQKEAIFIRSIELKDNNDLQIYFSNGMVFEYFVSSSKGQEEWQFRNGLGERLIAGGNYIILRHEEELVSENWWNQVII